MIRGSFLNDDVLTKCSSLSWWPPVPFQSFGMSELFANSFLDTVLKVAGTRPWHRECTQDNSALLLEIWKPKYTVHQWAVDHAAAFK